MTKKNITLDDDRIEVVVEELEDMYYLYNEAGQCLSPGFDSFTEAVSFAELDNYYKVVPTFNI